ncbi:MAG: AI-2E family transporter [Eubacteriales bacterium]|nr:AI-2E family transporter [Eubacteriales bacterium]
MNEQQNAPLTAKSLALALSGVVILYFVLANINVGFAVIYNLIAVAMPLIQGMAIAYMLNLPMRGIEKQLGKIWQKQRKGLRAVSLIFTLILSGGILAAVLMLLIPQLIVSVTDLGSRLPSLITQTSNWLNQTAAAYPWILEAFDSLHFTSSDLIAWFTQVISGNGAGWFSSTLNFVASAFGWVVSLMLSLIFAIYLLLAKDRLQHQLDRLLSAMLSMRMAQKIRGLAHLTHETFGHFLTGQFIEALILGGIFLVILIVFGFPYALLISVVIALTALIPMAGAYIGLLVGAFLILLINPWQALVFSLIFLIVQQLENNLIYPRIVGDSIGLPAIWVLAAVVLGGGLFGVLGMLLFIPLTSVVYKLLYGWVKQREKLAKHPE